jgi:hypothetical protein
VKSDKTLGLASVSSMGSDSIRYHVTTTTTTTTTTLDPVQRGRCHLLMRSWTDIRDAVDQDHDRSTLSLDVVVAVAHAVDHHWNALVVSWTPPLLRE